MKVIKTKSHAFCLQNQTRFVIETFAKLCNQAQINRTHQGTRQQKAVATQFSPFEGLLGHYNVFHFLNPATNSHCLNFERQLKCERTSGERYRVGNQKCLRMRNGKSVEN